MNSLVAVEAETLNYTERKS